MQSPLLPWEVIERVIGHSGDHRKALHNLSLTCRDLRPRALCLLVAHVVFERQPHIFDFCDFLQAKPHLKPLVRSITVHPTDFAPFPLLRILPNLSTLTFIGVRPRSLFVLGNLGDIPVLNRSSLTCCRLLGTHIQTLHFFKLYFPTYLDFARVLLVFANVKHLICSDVVIKAEGNQVALGVVKRRLSERLHLLSIGIDYFDRSVSFYEYVYNKPSVAALLLDSGLVRSTVETLTVKTPYRSWGLPHPLGWPQLRSLGLKIDFKDVTDALVFLKDFPPSTLKDVMVELLFMSYYDFIRLVSGRSGPEPWKELEQVLLRFPQPRIVFHFNSLRDGHSFWTQELGKRFPALYQREALTVVSRTVTPGASGHDDAVSALTPSPDGRWIATGSQDSTIILWNHIDGTIAQRWVAHSDGGDVIFLEFSPDGRYLLSYSAYSKIKIWGLTGGSGSPELTTTLGEDADNYQCGAWSPNGDIIASASDDRIIRLWDTRTFHQLRELKHADDVHIRDIAFSPDGRWLASACPHSYDIWNVASGTLHKSFPTQFYYAVGPLAFDLKDGMRLAIAAEVRAVKILDVETGGELAVLRDVYMPRNMAFSPDGSLVTNASDKNGTVKLWDAYTGAELFSLEGHEKRVNRARFSPCGKYVASASNDGTVRLWRTNDGSCIVTFSEHQKSGVLRVAFSPDGETLWSADWDGMVIMRRMRDVIPIDERVT